MNREMLTTMQYIINGVINFSGTLKFKLEKEVSFSTVSKIPTKLGSSNDNNLIVTMDVEDDELSLAKERATIELNRICNMLSYFQNIPISNCRTTGAASHVSNKEGKHIVTMEEIITLDDVLLLVRGLGPVATDQLVDNLVKVYSTEFEDILSMWRQAISEESPVTKYLLLYRVMESLFKNNTQNLTGWIMTMETEVPMFLVRGKHKVTLYTHLRHSIHPQRSLFPTKEIRDLLPRFQDLVKKAISDKFGNV